MDDRIRVAVFGSFYRGFNVLDELLNGESSSNVEVVGVATDDPSKSFTSPHRRVWRYEHTDQEERLVPDLAEAAGIETYLGRIKTDEFYDKLDGWDPQLCFSATFGQLINERIIGHPEIGFYNLHPSGEDWPSYVGPQPFEGMLEDGISHCVVSMHEVNEKFDDGKLVAKSRRIPIPPGSSVRDLHKITSPFAAEVVKEAVARYVETGNVRYK